MIELQKVHKSFGDLEVLKGIDLTVQKGEVLSVIGGSGSGKSTMLYCVNAIENIQSGKVLVDGKVQKRREYAQRHQPILILK